MGYYDDRHPVSSGHVPAFERNVVAARPETDIFEGASVVGGRIFERHTLYLDEAGRDTVGYEYVERKGGGGGGDEFG